MKMTIIGNLLVRGLREGVNGLVLGWEPYYGNKNIASGSTRSFIERGSSFLIFETADGALFKKSTFSTASLGEEIMIIDHNQFVTLKYFC